MRMTTASPTRKASGPGRVVLQLDWVPRELPEDTEVELATLVTHDGAAVRGALYRVGHPRTVVVIAHPRQDLLRAPHVPDLLRAGSAVFCLNTRGVNNDMSLSHEPALLDVAAAIEHLRESGFEHVVLLGASGGAGLFTFYTEQALTAPGERLEREPSGRPVDLPGATMPAPDALALFAPHPGQGLLLQSMLDPSVTDESDPLSCDPALDPFDPANGFDADGAHYDAAFVTRYRAAQRARSNRLDERAQELVAANLAARKRAKAGRASGDVRASAVVPIITVYRSDADLRSVDLSIEASDRAYGSILSPRPQVSNYGPAGFARVTTPHAWLSTWSAEHSQAGVARAAAGVTVPTLVLRYSADQAVFDSDIDALRDALAAPDVTFASLPADHFANLVTPGDHDGVRRSVDILTDWMASRTPWE